MANNEYLRTNRIDTTSGFTLDSNTDAAVKLFDNLPNKQYATVGYDGATSASITYDFGITTSVDRIIIQNHNLKAFRIFYDGVTANTFSFTDSKPTSTSIWSTNSTTNDYLIFATQQVTNITIQMDEAQTASTEKKVGQLWITEKKIRVNRNATSNNYKPIIDDFQINHKMSDGGSALYHIQNKFKASIKYTYVSTTARDLFKDLKDDEIKFAFVPFPTGTSWDSYIWTVSWIGGFDFINPQGNNFSDQGWVGNIRLEEIAL